MDGPELPSERAIAALARPRRSRPSTSVAEPSRAGGSAARHAPSSVPRGPSLSFSGDPNTLSSSIALSSDTASVSLEASTSAVATPALSAGGGSEARRPLWWGALSSLRTDDPGFVSATTAATAATPKAGLTASSLVPPEWRCSIDFSHEVESRAEAELQQLWATLWSATHSEAALQTALAGPQAAWNPYRPARGGQEVREEVLNSEVAEFKAMIPMDSLYVRGSAVAVPDRRAMQNAATAATSPHRPPHKSKRGGAAEAARRGEELLVMDDSGVDARPPVPRHPGGPTNTTAAAAVQTSSWAAQQQEAEAALFRYLWTAVVVPFYAEEPATSVSAAFPPMALRTSEDTGASLTLTPAEDKDGSGVVTAFWPTREDKRNWALTSPPASSSLSSSHASVREAEDAAAGGGKPNSPLARTQRTATATTAAAFARYPTDDLDVISDDSLEVEVLDERDDVRPADTHTPVKPKRESTAGPSLARPARRASRRTERPSTAGVQASVLSPGAETALGTPGSAAPTGATPAPAKQRARSARTDDAAGGVGGATTAAAAAAGPARRETKRTASPPLPTTSGGRVLRWAHTPTLRTTVAETAEEALMDAPPPKPLSSARRRPPTAQPLVSRSKRVASPSGGAQPPPQQQQQHGASAPTSAGDKHNTGNTHGTSATVRSAASATAARSGVASPGRRQQHMQQDAGGISSGPPRVQRPQRQLNASVNGAASHALQLLELRSRATTRSPYGQRLPSPAPTITTPLAFADEAPRWRKNHRNTILSDTGEVVTTGDGGRHGQLSPMMAPGQGQQRQQRRKHNVQPPSISGKQLAGQREESGAVQPSVTLVVGNAEERLVMPKARLAPLREVAAGSATSQNRHATPEAQRGTSALGRTPSAKARRHGKGGTQRSTSKEAKKAALQRPTTAQR